MHGALQGLTQNETATKYGQCQLQLWTKSYDIPPPALLSTDPLLPEFDPRYAVSSALMRQINAAKLSDKFGFRWVLIAT